MGHGELGLFNSFVEAPYPVGQFLAIDTLHALLRTCSLQILRLTVPEVN